MVNATKVLFIMRRWMLTNVDNDGDNDIDDNGNDDYDDNYYDDDNYDDDSDDDDGDIDDNGDDDDDGHGHGDNDDDDDDDGDDKEEDFNGHENFSKDGMTKTLKMEELNLRFSGNTHGK